MQRERPDEHAAPPAVPSGAPAREHGARQQHLDPCLLGQHTPAGNERAKRRPSASASPYAGAATARANAAKRGSNSAPSASASAGHATRTARPRLRRSESDAAAACSAAKPSGYPSPLTSARSRPAWRPA